MKMRFHDSTALQLPMRLAGQLQALSDSVRVLLGHPGVQRKSRRPMTCLSKTRDRGHGRGRTRQGFQAEPAGVMMGEPGSWKRKLSWAPSGASSSWQLWIRVRRKYTQHDLCGLHLPVDWAGLRHGTCASYNATETESKARERPVAICARLRAVGIYRTPAVAGVDSNCPA
jgi:hypothetical protein